MALYVEHPRWVGTSPTSAVQARQPVNQKAVYVQIPAGAGKNIRPIFLEPGDLGDRQIHGKPFTGQPVEVVLAEGLFQARQKLTSAFIHPKNGVGQRPALLIHRDKCLALGGDAQSFQLSSVHLTHGLTYRLDR
jgi:hypothetical protein